MGRVTIDCPRCGTRVKPERHTPAHCWQARQRVAKSQRAHACQLTMRGVEFAGEPVEGSVARLIEAALAVNATLLDLGAANLLEGHQEERAERLCNATAVFTLADAGEEQTT